MSRPQSRTARGRAAGERGALLLVLLVILFVVIVRLRVADVPLERDEGEYAYAGRLILRGVPPYQLAYNMKFPGTYYAYAAILALFGQTPWGIHVGLMLVNAATILLVFAVGRRLLGSLGAVVAASAFALLSIDLSVLGVFAHATHFVLLPALGGFLLLLRALQSRRALSYLGAGVLLGTAVLMKQHAVFFLPLGAGLVLWKGLGEGSRDLVSTGRRIALLAAGSAVPLAVLVSLFLAQGVLERFWFWTFRYAREYVSEVPLTQALPGFLEGLRGVTAKNLPLWILGGIGLVALWIGKWDATSKGFLTGLLATSFLAVCPGFYFREHYFILLLPAVALLAGLAIASLARLLGGAAPARVVALALFAAVAGYYVVGERRFLFSMSPRELSRTRYGSNPFIEAVEIARYVRERTGPKDPIGVLGSEPEIYFYADRISATGYVYTYPLMEPQPYAKKMQEEMIRQIESAHPAYLVFAQIGASWLARRESDQTIITWANRYTRECYERVGIADIHSKDTTTYLWDDQVRGYQPVSKNLVFTFRRKSDAPCSAVP